MNTRTITRIRWGPLAVAYLSLFVFGLSDNARGPLFPEILTSLELSDTAGSLMFVATSFGVLVGSLACRRLLLSISAMAGLRLSLCVMAVGLAGAGLAIDLTMLLVASLLFGIGAGGNSVSQNLLTRASCPPGYRRRAFSGLHAVYGGASLLAPLAVTGLAALGFDWRGAFLFLSGVPILLLAGSLPAPAERIEGVRVLPTSGAISAQLHVAAFASCCVVAELLVSTRLPLYLRRLGDYSAEHAALALSGFFLLLMVGRLLCAALPEQLSNVSILYGCTVATLILFVAGLWLEPLLLVVTGLTVAPIFPVTTEVLAVEFPDHLESALGILMATVSFALMGAHLGVGVLGDWLGLRWGMGLGPAALVAALILLAARRSPHRHG